MVTVFVLAKGQRFCALLRCDTSFSEIAGKGRDPTCARSQAGGERPEVAGAGRAASSARQLWRVASCAPLVRRRCTRGAQLATRTHRAAWPYSRARGSAAAAASPRGPPGPPRGGSRSRRRRRGRARCSGRRGGEGSGGGVGRRTRAPQRGRRVALPAPRQPLRGRRQSQTGVRGHGTGAGGTGRGAFDAGRCVEHSDVAHRSVGCIRAQPL